MKQLYAEMPKFLQEIARENANQGIKDGCRAYGEDYDAKGNDLGKSPYENAKDLSEGHTSNPTKAGEALDGKLRLGKGLRLDKTGKEVITSTHKIKREK